MNFCCLKCAVKPVFIRFTIPRFHAIKLFCILITTCLSFIILFSSPSFYYADHFNANGIPGMDKYSLKQSEKYYFYYAKDSRTFAYQLQSIDICDCVCKLYIYKITRCVYDDDDEKILFFFFMLFSVHTKFIYVFMVHISISVGCIRNEYGFRQNKRRRR